MTDSPLLGDKDSKMFDLKDSNGMQVRHFKDTRHAKLTLDDVTRLKKIRAMRRIDQLERQELFNLMYAGGGDDDGGMGGGDEPF